MAMRLCEICKQPIETERLESVTGTRLCTTHAEAIDAYGGEFIVSAQQERTSKAGSLKLNYGGIATSQKRNQEGMDRLKDDFELTRGG